MARPRPARGRGLTSGALPYAAAMPPTYTQAEQVIDPGKRYTAVIATDKGEIEIALDPSRAPRTVNNFVFLTRNGFYDGLTFHRVVPGFVIQGGCPNGSGTGGPGYKFADEPVSGEYIAGAVAMANSGPNSNGSQFFICTEDDRHKLAKSYNLFGQVTRGLDVVLQVRVGDLMRSVVVTEAA